MKGFLRFVRNLILLVLAFLAAFAAGRASTSPIIVERVPALSELPTILPTPTPAPVSNDCKTPDRAILQYLDLVKQKHVSEAVDMFMPSLLADAREYKRILNYTEEFSQNFHNIRDITIGRSAFSGKALVRVDYEDTREQGSIGFELVWDKNQWWILDF